ncbi:MAG: agmatine deiminase family protein [Paludibacter sp.]|jgi:agmatine/peptidylarginine deiminase|nr:agmatine deiminase family protein [Paludibacter sp.]
MKNPDNNIIFPAEWHPQSFVQLAYPHADTDWAPMLDEVCACFDEIIETILQYENVALVLDTRHKTQDTRLKTLAVTNNNFQFSIFNFQLNDTWSRDFGAITVFKGEKPTVLDFCFNGWGKKFPAELDNQITRQIYEKDIYRNYKYENHLDFILEGGSIESDGKGTILTTERCLLSENRNNLSKSDIEKSLIDFLGAKRVLWLAHGYLAGDDTDSHIDTLARFCPDDTVAYVKCNDTNDEHYAELAEMEKELQQFRTVEGKPYRLLPLPMADAVYENGERLPATYANFLIINGAVLVPTYNSPKDAAAIARLQTAFPDRKIIGINCLPLIKQHGSLHCVTMQFPSLYIRQN